MEELEKRMQAVLLEVERHYKHEIALTSAHSNNFLSWIGVPVQVLITFDIDQTTINLSMSKNSMKADIRGKRNNAKSVLKSKVLSIGLLTSAIDLINSVQYE